MIPFPLACKKQKKVLTETDSFQAVSKFLTAHIPTFFISY